MSMTDPIADMITRIRNGQMHRLALVKVPASKLHEGVLKVLVAEGYVQEFARVEETGVHPYFNVTLKYDEDGEPVIREIKRISKPGCRVYKKISDITKLFNGLGTYILSTSKGVMSDYQARQENLGGEVLCSVF